MGFVNYVFLYVECEGDCYVGNIVEVLFGDFVEGGEG